ncbi:low temperature requirement protein A [Micromonospora sp. NBC_01655]|uniref:low temperature requirement protein A n=1 Tax=Micromonospora sp. NBC_01655 TaxID=2975983 RepID=UPI00224FCB62|nr:low temperature requirement protein A [Micromonospora sp. NBC_01655]MCX4470839.1 low temperature requirement protein A [Micromonospora sp. NBC_01655]
MGRTSEPARAGGILRSEEDARQSSFLELFFDLVLVFALLGVVSRIVPDLLSNNVRLHWLSLPNTVVLALPLLRLWTTTTYITSRFDCRNHWIQLLVLVSAFGLLIMATSLPYEFEARGESFAVVYVLLHIGRPLLLRPLLREHEAIRALYTRLAIWSSVSGVVWLAGAVIQGSSRVALWLIAITVDLVAARFNWPIPGMRRPPASGWAMANSSHLPERYQQLLLIALGETVVSIGLTYANHPATLAATVALVITFFSSVLMWRIYFYRAGQVLAEAVAMSSNRAVAGGTIGVAHVLMVLGILAVAAGSEIVLAHPGGRSELAWLAVILGGPAVFLIGRIRLERIVFDRLALRRVVGIAALAVLMLALWLVSGAPLLAAIAAAVVLLGVAVSDARHAAGRPPEAPSPAA